MTHKQTIQCLSLVIVGIVLIITGTINTFFLKDIVGLYNKKLIKLSPSMKFYEDWANTPTHILNRIYFFNFTNPDDFQRNGTKPVLKELGPYTFKEYQKKINLTWNSNSTVTYKVHRIWYFEPGISNGTLDDNMTTISAIPMWAAHYFKDKGYFFQIALSATLSAAGEKVASTKTTNEYLFKGYEHSFSMISPYFEPTLKKWGHFHTFNDSTLRDGVLNVDTGGSDIKQVGKVRNWNYSPYQFSGGPITGNSGDLFASHLLKTNITLFTPWLCRDLHFDYSGEEYVDGVKGYKFILSERNFDNGSKYEENLTGWPEQRFPSGIANVSKCYYNAQGIVSYPHFYMADPYFSNQVEGMQPDPEKHQSYYIIEPMSGAPLKAKISVQVNYILRHSKSIRFYQKIPPVTIFPVFWLEKSFNLPETTFNFLKTYVFLVHLLEITAIPCLIIGLCTLFAGVVWNIKVNYTLVLCSRFKFLRKKKRRGSSFAIACSINSKADKYSFTKLPETSHVAERDMQENAAILGS